MGINLPISMNGENGNCPDTAYQDVNVSLPVTITPSVKVGDATVTCCGAPTISEGNGCCQENDNGSCTFTISQRVRVAMPVALGANVTGECGNSCGYGCRNGCDGCCDQCAMGDAALCAVRSAMDKGMIRMNDCHACGVNDCKNDCCDQRKDEYYCRNSEKYSQTRIQDLLNDPMIWKD